MKRLFWVGVGVATSVGVLRGARAVTDTYVPAGARSALGAVSGLAGLAHRAAAEFRAATAEREAELRADLLAGADPSLSRARVDAWRAERAGLARTADGDGSVGGPRAGSAAAAGATSGVGARRGGGSHRAQDPDDGPLGYSFF